DDGIRDWSVTGVQTCALPILTRKVRFHPPAAVPEFAASWAEWLYFNGRTSDGKIRFYLTFLVTPSAPSGWPESFRAGVRLQLERSEERRVGKRAVTGGSSERI